MKVMHLILRTCLSISMWKYKWKFWLASTDTFRAFQFFLGCSPSPFLPVSIHPFLMWAWQILLEEKMPQWATATPCYTSLLFSSSSVCLTFILSALLYPSIMDNFNPDIHPPRYFVWIPSINKVSGSHEIMATLLNCLFNLLFSSSSSPFPLCIPKSGGREADDRRGGGLFWWTLICSNYWETAGWWWGGLLCNIVTGVVWMLEKQSDNIAWLSSGHFKVTVAFMKQLPCQPEQQLEYFSTWIL